MSDTASIRAADALTILVADADAHVREACRDVAKALGFEVRLAESADATRHIASTFAVHIILMDLRLPAGGLELLRWIRDMRPDAAVIIVSASTSVPFAVEAMRFGAYDFLVKPFHLEELRTALIRAAQQLRITQQARGIRERMAVHRGYLGMVGDSPEMEKLYRIISRTATSASPALITGESGTGKELAARAIHSAGPNSAHPFIVVDCQAMMPSRLEAELFGDSSRANHSPDGLIAASGGGTILFDEIAALPLNVQGKLLRAMQDREYRPLHSTATRPWNVRMLASSSRDLEMLCANGSFRRDLYLRLNVVHVRVPPLRQRKQDIPLLAEHFFQRFSRNRSIGLRLSDGFMQSLMQYDWLGNVRELETCIERACSVATGGSISAEDLLTKIKSHAQETAVSQRQPVPPGIIPLAELEKTAILEALQKLGGDRLEAAKHLGIGKTTLYRKLREYEAAGTDLHFAAVAP